MIIKKEIKEFKLFGSFDGFNLTLNGAIEELKKYGYRPANLEELLVYEKQEFVPSDEEHLIFALDAIKRRQDSELFSIAALYNSDITYKKQTYISWLDESIFLNYCYILGIKDNNLIDYKQYENI